MITASEAIFIALISLFPSEVSSETYGSIYAQPEGDHYKIIYIHPAGIRAVAPEHLAIETHQLDVDKETGEPGEMSVYTYGKLEGLKQPYAFWKSENVLLSIRDILEKAQAAVPDKKTYDPYGTLQVVRNKDDYEVIFPPVKPLEPGSRGDDFAYIVRIDIYGKILDITAPR